MITINTLTFEQADALLRKLVKAERWMLASRVAGHLATMQAKRTPAQRIADKYMMPRSLFV